MYPSFASAAEGAVPFLYCPHASYWCAAATAPVVVVRSVVDPSASVPMNLAPDASVTDSGPSA